MSSMRQADDVIALFCADIHLSSATPIWRSPEPDWFAVMARALEELCYLQQKYRCPVLCAGDIFQRWNSTPELINFALRHLPDDMYAIPGQHDLPDHNYEEIERSAFWTLVEAQKIHPLPPYMEMSIDKSLIVYSFPYGFDIKPLIEKDHHFYHIAICHQYFWIPGHSYKQAPKELRLGKQRKKMQGYDVVVLGDNHHHFRARLSNTRIYNCGCFMHRRLDEKKLRPAIGLLLADGSIKTHHLDISKDKHLTNEDEKTINKLELDMSNFLDQLDSLGDTELDFVEAVRQYMLANKVKGATKKFILDAMEKKN